MDASKDIYGRSSSSLDNLILINDINTLIENNNINIDKKVSVKSL
jgi:hypothetical protein